jgi:hypothetical protein
MTYLIASTISVDSGEYESPNLQNIHNITLIIKGSSGVIFKSVANDLQPRQPQPGDHSLVSLSIRCLIFSSALIL